MNLLRLGRRSLRPVLGGPRAFARAARPGLLHNRSQLLILALAFVVLVAAVAKPPEFRKRKTGYDVNTRKIATEEVVAEIYFETEDLAATKARRDEAVAKTPDTYRVDRERVQRQLRDLGERIDQLAAQRDAVYKAVREAIRQSAADAPEMETAQKAAMDFAARLKEDPAFAEFPEASVLAIWLMPDADAIPLREPAGTGRGGESHKAARLLEPKVTPMTFAHASDLARLAREGLEYTLTYGVLEPDEAGQTPNRTIVVVRDSPMGAQKMSDEMPVSRIPRIEEARDLLNDSVLDAARQLTTENPDRAGDWAKLQRAAYEMAEPLVVGSLFFDPVSTESARERARLSVAPVMKEVEPGEVIQDRGSRWTPQSRSDVLTYWAKLEAQQQPRFRLFTALVAQAIFVGLVLTYLVRSLRILSPHPQEGLGYLNLALLVMTATLVTGRVVSYFEPSGFILPAVAGGILMAILVSPRVAILTSTLTAMLVSVQFGYDWRLLFVGSSMSVAGVFGISRVRRRSDMTRAALKATAVGILAILAVTLAQDSLASGKAVSRILLVVLNGTACIFIVPGVLSPLERLFRITTDIQLLEYSDLNNELLSRMAIEMPATYAHSLMLGQLAEAAAEAIGANGLLARVCAYYHDVGKLRRPEYFSENQTGVNIHDGLPPRLSARAIASHVACGVELAREHHLPKPVVDAIREHHGTTLISFFYQQALERQKHDSVRVEDFRYPGPKPQSPEAAILMICDAVESGVRSIKNPNEERIREFIDKVIASRSADRQFDESDLTLKQLDTIKEAVAQRMATALHTRIAYPERKTEKKAPNVVHLSGGTP